MRTKTVFLLALLLLSTAALAVAAEGPAPSAAPEAAVPTVDDFAWMVGHWRGEALGGVAEEVWLPAAGGAMSGFFRHVRNGEVGFYEIFTIAEPDLHLRLKHFNADLTGWEEKDEVVTFSFIRVTPTEAVFEGLRFRLLEDGRLQAIVRTTNAKGEVGELEFLYERVAAPPASEPTAAPPAD